MKAFQAYSTHGKTTATTPRVAALTHFERFPRARKCTVIQGDHDGTFFTVSYSLGAWPQSFKDVTRKTARELPA